MPNSLCHAVGVGMVVAHCLKVAVLHGIFRCHSLSMVIPQHLAQQVEGLVRDELVILRVNELGPRLAGDGLRGEDVLVVGVKGEAVLVKIGVELLSAEYLGNLHKLIVVIRALEEGFAFEDHASKHAAQRPDIKRVVISLQVNQKLGTLEVAGSYAHIVLLTWVVELGQSPIDEAELAVGMVNHDVMRLHIAVHDALRVTVIEGLQDLEHVVANVEVIEALVKFAEVGITRVNKLGDDCRCLRQWITNDIKHVNDINATLERLQNFDLTSDLVLLDYSTPMNMKGYMCFVECLSSKIRKS